MGVHKIDRNWLTLAKVDEIIQNDFQLELSQESIDAIKKCRAFLDEKMASNQEPIYGINTGFGSLCNTEISASELEKLQRNLVMSHACGMGDQVEDSIVALMLLFKIQGLSYGHSGVQLTTVQRLIDFYNNKVYPIVYEQGSLGASGDLAPLAHLSLPLIGLGEVHHQGKIYSGKQINEKFGWEPIALKSKEGLALLNGTQFMSAFGIHSLIRVKKLGVMADIISAVSLEAYDGRISPFNELVHKVRPHDGQYITAKNVSQLLQGSDIITQHKAHVQDPYSFRCIPQVHGASKDAVNHVQTVFEKEINSVTDNPTIFPDEGEIISAGNFHGQPLAIALDYLSIAISELGSIAERRTYKLIGGERGLPAFLVDNPGLNSGFMIPQYAAASIVSQNKQLATPCSVDTIDSSNGQEDHVSMGANAGTKVYRQLNNLARIMGIELLCACQGIHYRKPLHSSGFIEDFVGQYREVVPFVENDCEMHPIMEKSKEFVADYAAQLKVQDFIA